MISVWLLALAGSAMAAEQPVQEPAVVEAHAAQGPAVVVWLGGSVEPVKFTTDGYSARLGVQAWMAKRFGVEWATEVYARPRDLLSAQPLVAGARPGLIQGRLADPTWASDIRLQFAVLRGELQAQGRPVPITLTVDLGAGAIGTQEDPHMLQCDGTTGAACTSTLSQVHPTWATGSTLTVTASERIRVRGVLLYRGWVETIDGTSLERMGSTSVGVDIGVELGPKPRRASKFEPPAPPEDPLYDNTL